jgi:hypothetical protein
LGQGFYRFQREELLGNIQRHAPLINAVFGTGGGE